MLKDFIAGIRVLDLSQYLPGPFATQILADMGADVIKVEPPAGDPLRHLDPVNGGASVGQGPSPYYRVVNAGKRVLALDLKSAAGRETFETLIGVADVLLESYRPGVLDRLGLGSERLSALNPRLVHCALSGYGQTGPHRLTAGHDLNYVASSGALGASGTAAAPVMAWPPVADHASGMQAALAILGALSGRRRDGRGVHIDLSLAETVLAWQGWGLTATAEGRAPVAPARNVLNGGAAYYQVYGTADGRFLTIGAIEEKFWANLCEAMGRPEWKDRYHDPMPQWDLVAEVTEMFCGKALAEWDELLSTIDCCYHAVLAYDEVPDHPHVRARRLVRRGDGGDPATQVLFPAWIDGQAPQERTPVRDIDVEQALAAWDGKTGDSI